MSTDITWRGAGGIHEDDNSPKFSFGEDKDTCTRTFRCARYEEIETEVPEIGASMASVEAAFPNARAVDADLRNGFKVVSSDLQPEKGGKGVLTVKFERAGGTSIYSFPADSSLASSAASSAAEPPSEYGCDWVEVAKPIEQNEYFAEIANEEELLALVEDALNARKASERETALQKAEDINALARFLYAKKRRGQTHYTIYGPVAERVTYSDQDPGTDGCGQIEPPPSECGAPGEYEYRKTADKKHFDGTRWQRTEQWTGADAWDHDLYS